MNNQIPVIGSVWRHQKRGTEYRVVDVTICCTNGLHEGEPTVIYEQLSEGELGSKYQKGVRMDRIVSEFMDGRFELVLN